MTIFQNLCGRPWIRRAAVGMALAVGLVCAATPTRGQAAASAHAKPAAHSVAQAAHQEDRIHNIESTVVDISMGEQPPIRLSLAALMHLYKVPALSIALIDDYKIVWAQGYGTIGTGSSAPATTKTLFQAGSIASRSLLPARWFSWSRAS